VGGQTSVVCLQFVIPFSLSPKREKERKGEKDKNEKRKKEPLLFPLSSFLSLGREEGKKEKEKRMKGGRKK